MLEFGFPGVSIRLFELYNYDRHGKLSVDEFVTMRLNQKCSHANVSQAEGSETNQEKVQAQQAQFGF